MSKTTENQLQERLDNFIEIIDEGNMIQDKGVENIITGINNSTFLLTEDQPVHSFSLSTLRRFPRYLCDAILIPHTTAISYDHHLYWGWTAAYISYSETQDQETDTDMMSLMQDFYSLIHLCLLPVRQSTMDQRVSQFIQSMNPSLQGIEHQGFSLASSTGFSLLEGFVRRHCEDLQADGGLTVDSIEDPSWRSTPVENPIYHDKLQIWKEREASQKVAQSLREIDDLNRYDQNLLARKIGGGEQSVERRNNFLSVLSDQRNSNIHGEISTQVIGPVVLNLCCLLIWDRIEDEEFESTRKELLQRLDQPRHGGATGLHPQWPSAFYPL